jgi:hypothetical protein
MKIGIVPGSVFASGVDAPIILGRSVPVERGVERVGCETDGQPWVQAPCVCYATCLRWLHEAYVSLDDAARRSVDGLLAGTRCERLFAAA